MAHTNAPAILCTALAKNYPPDVSAVDGLDLRVERGECFGLLGPNGAGKTTTVEILEGLIEQSSGEAEVLGMSWRRAAAALRPRIGVSLQQTYLPDRLSVEEILALFRSFYGSGPTVEELLAKVSLTEKRAAWFDKLSGGQKQRLAVATALAGDPELVFLDEPTTGLDPQSRRQLWSLIDEMKDRGRTVLLTTHYMDEAEQLCGRVAVIDRGKVIAEGTPRALINGLGGRDVIEFSLSGGVEPNAQEIQRLSGVRSARRGKDGWSLAVEHFHVAIPALLELLSQRNLELDHLATHSATLEDVFVSLTGRHLRD